MSRRTFLRLGRFLRVYRDDLGGYMHRWIAETPLGTLRLHHILRSDAGRDLHDHPWDFWSLLLTGGYYEVTPDPDVPWATRGRAIPRWSLVRRKAEDLHQLLLDRPVWTLVWTGPKRRSWGFQTRRGWVNWRQYHASGREWHQGRVRGAGGGAP